MWVCTVSERQPERQSAPVHVHSRGRGCLGAGRQVAAAESAPSRERSGLSAVRLRPLASLSTGSASLAGFVFALLWINTRLC